MRGLQRIGGLPEALRGLELTLGGYDLGPPLALALGLTRHGPLHLLRDLDVLDLYDAYLYPPGVGMLVDDALKFAVYGLPVGKQVVQVLVAQHASKRGLADLARRQHEVLDLDDALVRVHDPEVDYGVDPRRYVIAGYYVLRRHVHRNRSEVHFDHLVYKRQQDKEARSFRPSLYSPETEDHTPLVLVDDFDGADHHGDDKYRQDKQHHRPP